MTGKWPTALVDHEDLDRGNNKWLNLREATYSQNQKNRTKNKNNTSGYKNVYFDKSLGAYRALVSIDGKRRKIGGRFKTAEEAYVLACKAARIHYGKFARF